MQFLNIMTDGGTLPDDIHLRSNTSTNRNPQTISKLSMHVDASRQSQKLLRRDLTIVSEIKATNTTSSDCSFI